MKHRETEDRIKINRASVTCGTISNDLTLMNLEFQKGKRYAEEGDRKNN